jgi:protein-serine/threonine kinase
MGDIQPSAGRNKDYAGRYVYPDDAEDIKAHKWFRDILWDRLHTMVPPFVPDIKSVDDTHYFDEEEPISDFSESVACIPNPTIEDILDAIKAFPKDIQDAATRWIEKPYDSVKFRKIEKEMDRHDISDEQKQFLKIFVKTYGRKEKKRPRDKLLRDRLTAPEVLEIRKKGAFLGYTYKRMRINGGGESSPRQPIHTPRSVRGKATVWHRAGVSLH